MFELQQNDEHRPEHGSLFPVRARIKVIGIGGGGCNAVNRMIAERVQGVEFIAMNTDAQALAVSKAARRVQLGESATKGLGSGGDPEVGRAAAEESGETIRRSVADADMVFIAAGLGGGTGTGGAPLVARAAREAGALTVAVVTKPFLFEGPRRKRVAEEGAARITEFADTIITVPNDRLLEISERRTTLQEAFAAADDVLRQGVQGISDIILQPGIINVDFADVRAVMKDAGSAMMGLGRASGQGAARVAAEKAANSPLLERNIQGARRLLVNIESGSSLALNDIHEAMEYLVQFTEPDDADVIVGHVLRSDLGDEVMITLMAACVDKPSALPAAQAAVEQFEPLEGPLPTAEEESDLALDIPTFLRRQRQGEP